MIFDTQTIFSGPIAADGTRTGQPITATAISTNVVDTKNAATPATVDEGLIGGQLWLVVAAITAAAGGDAAKTLTITLESDVATSLASAPVVHHSTPAILGSAITAGAVLARFQLPSGDHKRYLGLRYTVSAGFTAFGVVAFLTSSKARNLSYASSVSMDS